VTNPEYRHRILVIDRSGSIRSILKGQQDGLGELLSSEASLPGKVTFSLWDFDTEVRCVASLASVNDVARYKIEPRGGTSMYDALGTAVARDGEKLAALPEDQRPADVTVIVSSDGQENSSQEWTGTQVAELLEDQQKTYGWRVLYMGCNQDALKEGAKIGTQGGMTVNTVSSNAGSRNAYKMSSNYLTRVPFAAAASGQSVNLTPEERALGESGEEQENAGNSGN
jgi:hypothetical protein